MFDRDRDTSRLLDRDSIVVDTTLPGGNFAVVASDRKGMYRLNADRPDAIGIPADIDFKMAVVFASS